MECHNCKKENAEGAVCCWNCYAALSGKSRTICSTPCCDDCKYESPEERHNGADWWWEYFCNLADGRQIEREDGEPSPEWCPLGSNG